MTESGRAKVSTPRSAMQQLPGVDGSTGRVYLRSMVQQLAERQHTQAPRDGFFRKFGFNHWKLQTNFTSLQANTEAFCFGGPTAIFWFLDVFGVPPKKGEPSTAAGQERLGPVHLWPTTVREEARQQGRGLWAVPKWPQLAVLTFIRDVLLHIYIE